LGRGKKFHTVIKNFESTVRGIWGKKSTGGGKTQPWSRAARVRAPTGAENEKGWRLGIRVLRIGLEKKGGQDKRGQEEKESCFRITRSLRGKHIDGGGGDPRWGGVHRQRKVNRREQQKGHPAPSRVSSRGKKKRRRGSDEQEVPWGGELHGRGTKMSLP